jgi:hypothetical protein
MTLVTAAPCSGKENSVRHENVTTGGKSAAAFGRKGDGVYPQNRFPKCPLHHHFPLAVNATNRPWPVRGRGRCLAVDWTLTVRGLSLGGDKNYSRFVHGFAH